MVAATTANPEILETPALHRQRALYGTRLTAEGGERPNLLRFGKHGVAAADGETVTDLFQRTGLYDTRYVKMPIEAVVTGEDGSVTRMAMKQRVIMRYNTDGSITPVGTPVAANYTLLQNAQVALTLDQIVKRFPLDAVGALEDGNLVMLSFKAGSYRVRGIESEATDQYLRVTNGFGGVALRLAVTHVRLHCTNTLQPAWEGASARWSFKHYGNIEDDFSAIISLADAIDMANQRMRGDFDNMAARQISDADALKVFQSAYKSPKLRLRAQTVALAREMNLLNPDLSPRWLDDQAGYDSEVERHGRQRDAFMERYSLFKGPLEHTPYAAYQTIAELVDASISQTEEKHIMSVLDGEGGEHTRLAYRAALKLADHHNN